MSKERLEEIKLKFNNTIDTMLYVPYEDVKFLIKQAERVQELEELVEGYKIELMIKDNAKKRANQQNKRYREAIEVAIHNMAASDNLGVKFALGILEQALEGEE